MDSCELTILMPCLNEAETLSTCIDKARSFLTRANINGEILIADNGSHDGSQQIAEQHGARVIAVDLKGYGSALKSGIQQARGRYIIMGDADNSYDFLNLDAFVNKLRQGYDLVMGNRFMGGIMQGAMPFLNQYLGNPVLSLIGRTFFSSKVGDFHCGLRGFDREKFLKLGLQGDGMEFASEMVVKASLNHFKIAEVPTTLHPDGRSRKPHLRPWRDGWRHLRLLLLFSPRWLFLYPGLFLMLTGLTLMLALALGPISIGNVNFDIHTMLFGSTFIITGLQAVCFAVFARYIASQRMHLPEPYQLSKLFKLERGLLLGGVMLCAGLSGSCYSLWCWAHQAFGPLVPTDMMRILIPSATGVIVGLQLMFASFFMSLLDLHHHG